MSIFLNSHIRLLSAQLQLKWSVKQTINVYPPCHQSGRRRVLAALITTADDAGHPTSAPLITGRQGRQGRQGRRSIYRHRVQPHLVSYLVSRSVSHFYTTVTQRSDDFVSRYFVSAKCWARRKFLAGLDHKPSSVRTRLIV